MSLPADFLKQATQLFQPNERKKEWYEELEEGVCSACPTMNWQQRLSGCLFCMVLGSLLSFGSMTRLFQLLKGNPIPFASMYTIGNIISISSTCFLYGPWAQAKKMFAPTRLIATIAYFSCMALTLFLVFYSGTIPARGLFLLIVIFLQFIALSWYTLSFIPYAREFLKSFCKNTCCGCLREQNDDFWG